MHVRRRYVEAGVRPDQSFVALCPALEMGQAGFRI